MITNDYFRTAVEAINVIVAHLDTVLTDEVKADIDKVTFGFIYDLRREMNLVSDFMKDNEFPISICYKYGILSGILDQIEEILSVQCEYQFTTCNTNGMTEHDERDDFMNDMISNRIYELIQGLYELQDEMEGQA